MREPVRHYFDSWGDYVALWLGLALFAAGGYGVWRVLRAAFDYGLPLICGA